ncbi:MAG: TSUP family transporter [Proteobacteria bacterium]|nr:TSUP family transporter [Pseudomonadota bacterium]
MLEITLLCGFSFLAGLIDSVAGGGGLIQLPALFIILPNLPVALLLGTNKLSSIAGTSIASLQYAMHVDISWKATLPATIAALIFSFLGARTVSMLNPGTMRPVILFLLVAIAAYTFIRKDFGTVHIPKLGHRGQFLFSIITGTVIGFYDGFFGPGTGSFLIFVFISIFGFNFLSASASSKVINFATNLSAVLYFAFTDNILYKIALPMAVCNILGSLVGTRLAILKGSRFVRVFFLIVVSGLIIKLAYDTFRY